MFVNYAHRGASAYYPENTRLSFQKGIELGANGIELDLQCTKDGKIVIFHDDIIDKKSTGKGYISDYSYEELQQLDFGRWFHEKYTGIRIMLFEEFAKEYFLKDMTFAIEIKSKNIEKQTLDIIHHYMTHDKIYISSFDYDILKRVRGLDAEIKISWLIDEEITDQNIKKLLSIKGNQICPRAALANKIGIDLAKENGLGVRLWGVENETIMKDAFLLDTEGMTVNFPDKLANLMKRKC